MAKKTVALDGLLNTQDRPKDTGVQQRGAASRERKPPESLKAENEKKPKREGEKRLTLALDGVTYKRLRLHAVDVDRTHQDIIEDALKQYLNDVNT